MCINCSDKCEITFNLSSVTRASNKHFFPSLALSQLQSVVNEELGKVLKFVKYLGVSIDETLYSHSASLHPQPRS